MAEICKEQIVVDVTGWSEGARQALRSAIESFETGSTGSTTNPVPMPEAPVSETPQILDEVLMRLIKAGAAVQHAAIKDAITHGGEISRDKVYEIGDFPSDRSLRGFTRPVRGVVKKMVTEGLLSQTAVDEFFTPIYDPNVKGYQRTSGFRVNLDALTSA